jgi:hypothetical protein
MELNSIKPADGAKHAKRRVGRGIGSGLGKTAGRGHKGQKSRSGGYHKVGLKAVKCLCNAVLPKRGFKSHLLKFNAEVTLDCSRPTGPCRSGRIGSQASWPRGRAGQGRQGHQEWCSHQGCKAERCGRNGRCQGSYRSCWRQRRLSVALKRRHLWLLARLKLQRPVSSAICVVAWFSVACAGRVSHRGSYPVPGIDPAQLQQLLRASKAAY